MDARPYPVHNLVDGASFTTIIDDGVTTPSGLVLKDDVLYVADYATGRISAYSTAGDLIDYLDTGRENALQGMNFGPDGGLYVADGDAGEVFRLTANPDAFLEE